MQFLALLRMLACCAILRLHPQLQCCHHWPQGCRGQALLCSLHFSTVRRRGTWIIWAWSYIGVQVWGSDHLSVLQGNPLQLAFPGNSRFYSPPLRQDWRSVGRKLQSMEWSSSLIYNMIICEIYLKNVQWRENQKSICSIYSKVGRESEASHL